MAFSEKSVAEFSRIWEAEFGDKLSQEDAQVAAERLLELALLLTSSSNDYEP